MYWQERFSKLELESNKAALKVKKEVAKEYDIAKKRIKEKLALWYSKIKDFADGKARLDKSELKEFKLTVDEYIKVAKIEGLPPAWQKVLERISARVHITRLEALELDISQAVERLAVAENNITASGLSNIYATSFYRTAFELQKGLGVKVTFQGVDDKKLKTVINSEWSGKDFSSRVWEHKEKLKIALKSELTQAIIQGEDYRGATERLANKLETAKHAAGRLIMTEAAYISNKARIDSLKELGCEEYEFIATLDNKTSAVCQSMDKKHFKITDFKAGITAPPMHPNCRSCIAPYFADAKDEERIGRDKRGRRKAFNGDISYGEWLSEINH